MMSRQFSVPGRAANGILFAVLLTLGTAPSLKAANLLSATSPVTLTCNTLTGPGTNGTIVVKPVTTLTSTGSISVTIGSLPAGVVAITTPSNQTLTTSNQSAGLSYVINYTAGCVGATAGTSTAPIQFSAGGVSDVSVTANSTITATATPLTASPSTATVLCVKNGATYVPGAAQTISITSAATGGTAFTVDTASHPVASWLTVTPTTSQTATPSPVTLTVQAASGCGGFSTGTTNTTTVHLLNAPAPDKTIAVSLQVVSPTPLTATPAAPKLTYTKGSGTPGFVDVNITGTGSPAPFVSVDTTTLPVWLTVTPISGTTPKSFRFSTTTVCDSLAPGTYMATVNLNVAGSAPLGVPISLSINNPAATLTVAEGTTRNLTWTLGQPAPTAVITAVSSDSPIPYTLTSGGTLAPVISAPQTSGLAYNFGTAINVSFSPNVLAAAQPGNVLTGTVTLTWGNPASTTVVTFNLTILSPASTLTSVSPASLPTASSGSFTVALSGTGFIVSTDPTQKTKVGVVVGGVLTLDNSISWTVVNPSSIIMTISVPVGTDANLPFAPSGAGGAVHLGVCNPVGGNCTVATGTATLAISSGPIVQVVTSASSFIQVNPGSTPTVAPYDIVTIFGTGFCSSAGTGCSSSTILYPTLNSALQYPTTLSPDAVSATQRQLSVRFQTQGSSPVTIANANLLFANNNQINLLVPSGVASHAGGQVDIVVSFGYGTGTTLLNSSPFHVNIAATNPGIFTVGADGQGSAAVLNSVNYSLIAPGNEAGMRAVTTGNDSDTVLFYVTGLGVPDSSANNASSGGGSYSDDCISPASYLTSLNGQTGGSLVAADGLIIQYALLNSGRLSPCVTTASADLPTITIGNVAGTVTYAGWVANSVAGLFQMNVKLPKSNGGPFTDPNGATIAAITAPVQLPVAITANGRTSQTGVTVWVAPRLKLVAPATLTGMVGTAWATTNNAVAASEGTSPYRYAVTSGFLPSGLTLNTSNGQVTGTPAAGTAGTYAVTVTANDSANVPVSGSVTFQLTVAGGLVLSTTGTSPFTGVFGITGSDASLTTVSASGGVFPYTYAITTPSTLPTGLSIDPNLGVVGITTATPAGTYHTTVTATDSLTPTAYTGTANFDVVVALNLTNTSPTDGTNSQVNANLATVSATGNTGTVTYALDPATATAYPWLAVDPSSGIVSTTSGAVAGAFTVTINATDGTAAPQAAIAGKGTVTFSIMID